MRYTVAKFVAQLNDIQKQNIFSVCKDLEDQTNNDRNVLSKVFLFPKMKIQLKKDWRILWRFKLNHRICVTSRNRFQRCLQQWEKYWAQCVNSKWNYCEGDSVCEVSLKLSYSLSLETFSSLLVNCHFLVQLLFQICFYASYVVSD